MTDLVLEWFPDVQDDHLLLIQKLLQCLDRDLELGGQLFFDPAERLVVDELLDLWVRAAD